MKMFKIHNMISTQSAILLSGIIIGASIFLTTWVFFGGNGNRQKLFIESPQPRTAPQTLTPDQIKKIQEQRAAQIKKEEPSEETVAE